MPASTKIRLLVIFTGLVVMTFSSCSSTPNRVEQVTWGEVDGEPVHLYTLTNSQGTVARITDYGAILTELHVADRDGKFHDVVLGFDSLEGYTAGHPYFGCIAGRVANRIAGGRFSLDGKSYSLATNNGPNHLHGGNRGFDKAVWKSEPVKSETSTGVRLFHRSPDGDEGYPGNLNIEVVYTLTNNNELRVEMAARTDRATPVNLVHHSYWNLAGHNSGDIMNHELKLECSRYTPTDDTLIPTGEMAGVKGTPFDFTTSGRIGDAIAPLKASKDAGHGGGYDLNLVVDGDPGANRLVATVSDPGSGRRMTIHAAQPGVQFYTGNFLDGSNRGKGGNIYNQYQGFCLETQHFPDSINHPEFPSVVLRPGGVYRHVMVHTFDTN